MSKLAAIAVFLPTIVIYADDFAIVNVTVTQIEGGATAPAWYEFNPGEKVHLSFLVSGFKSTGDDDKVLIEHEVQAVDPNGTLIAPPQAGKIAVELAREDKDWRPPVRFDALVPQVPLAGRYKFKIVVRDRIAGTEVVTEVPFQVRSTLKEIVDTFTLQDFQFEGQPPYRRGEPVSAKFYLTGYKFGPKNRYEVQYGVQVRDPAGKVLVNDRVAASESTESFYPRRQVPGGMAVTLDRKNPPGEYTVVISARDLVGDQQIETEFPLRLE